MTELQILKSKIYRKNIDLKFKNNFEPNKIQLYIKKIAHIIYEFHIMNKRILFLNFPKNIEKKLIKNLKSPQHIFISCENFLNGIISNQKINFQQSNKLQKVIKNNSKIKISAKKLIDLIVIYNPLSSLNSDKKLYISQIPTITINENFNNNLNLKQNYKLIGHFKFIEKQVNNNLFFSILKSILKNHSFKKQNTNLYKQNIKKAIKS
uniref:Ribosomal protein S2 n=1 Tax=Pleurosigma inscriptura TaxID=2819025 RepID=A0A8A3SPZ0_9STRA|nr:ribosomal protein S2 [Pleurosigma inscriptura]QSZ78233.1 ribosomal protein S2 [Pleurosigma inscriptura]